MFRWNAILFVSCFILQCVCTLCFFMEYYDLGKNKKNKMIMSCGIGILLIAEIMITLYSIRNGVGRDIGISVLRILAFVAAILYLLFYAYFWTVLRSKTNTRKHKIIVFCCAGALFIAGTMIIIHFSKGHIIMALLANIFIVLMVISGLGMEDKGDRDNVEPEELDNLIDNTSEMSAQEFFFEYATAAEISGCFVLHNRSKDKYYIGKGDRIAQRVFWYLCGGGNADIYADYAFGDAFTVKVFPIEDSSYASVDALERALFKKYVSYGHLYNRVSWGMN